MRKLLWDYKKSFVGLPFVGVAAGQVAKYSVSVLLPACVLYAITFRPFKRVYYDIHDSQLHEK